MNQKSDLTVQQTETTNISSPKNSLSTTRRTIIALIGGAVAAAIFGGALAVLKPKPVDERIISEILNSDTVKNTDKETESAVDESIEDLHLFFEDAKKNVPQFADEVLGFKNKFWAAVDMIPFTEKNRCEEYITRSFEKNIFTQEQIVNEIKRAVTDFLSQIDNCENMMLYQLSEDLADIPEFSVDEPVSYQWLLDQFDKQQETLVNQSISISHKELIASLSKFVLSEVITTVGVNLTVSAGILGTSGATAAETFGISIAVGIIADYFVNLAWNKIADPEGKLIEQMNQQIDTLENLIINGTDQNQKGIRSILEDWNKKRCEERSIILRQILEQRTEN